jgi:hypothetical protein
MWGRTDFIHPSRRRFKTKLGLTGTTLTQEISGIQTYQVAILGASMAEYASAVREMEGGKFREELSASGSEMINFGISCFKVEISGKRKLMAGVTDDGSYLFTSANK